LTRLFRAGKVIGVVNFINVRKGKIKEAEAMMEVKEELKELACVINRDSDIISSQLAGIVKTLAKVFKSAGLAYRSEGLIADSFHLQVAQYPGKGWSLGIYSVKIVGYIKEVNLVSREDKIKVALHLSMFLNEYTCFLRKMEKDIKEVAELVERINNVLHR
jgi:hypothetical protein